MSRSSILAPLVAVALLALPGAAIAEDKPVIPAPADWGRALAEDARAFHDLIADSHPGPVDPENPGFNALLEAGLATALERAKTADSYDDWFFALQIYAASFDDGHLSLFDYQPMGHDFRSRWPGFLTGLHDGAPTVMFTRDASGPPLGARLIDCDGRKPDALAAELIGGTAGRWTIKSRRTSMAGQLFVDRGNPYVRRPQRCVFEADGKATAYDLAWRDLPDALRDEALAATRSPRFTTPIELREFAGKGFWIGLGSFQPSAASEQGQKLTALQAAVETRADDIRAAPVVVFDLRGNNGGSSSWIYGLVRTLWGEAWVQSRQPGSDRVDWRASPANLAQISSYHGMFGDNPEAEGWLTRIETGLSGAIAKGQPLWAQTDDESDAGAAPADPRTAMTARVYFITDYGCASACLDAVDVLKALGAVHVGQETSGDAVYMEIRTQPLPGGRVTAGIPMKVYRGRPRGNNETVVPAHEWTGALADTAGLEALIIAVDTGR